MRWNRSNPKITQGTKSANSVPGSHSCCQPTAKFLQLPSRGSALDVRNEKTKVCIRRIYLGFGPSHHYLIFPNLRGHFIILIVPVEETVAAMPPGTCVGEGTGSMTLAK